MKKLKLQAVLLTLAAVWILISIGSVFMVEHPAPESETVEAPAAKSEIGGRDNAQSRLDYEDMLLADPATGQVPLDIRKKELKFAEAAMTDALLQDELLQSVSGTDATEATQTLDWNQVGPENFGGRTRAFAIDVTNERTLLAGGVSGGVWRSEDAGASWTKTTTPEQLQSVTAIVQDSRPGKENIWYYGTGELVGNSTRARGAPFRGDGIFKSTDGGRSWQQLASTVTNNPGSFDFPFNYVWDITINPANTDQDEVIAAVFGGVVRSLDGGATWTTVIGNDLLALGSTDLNDVSAIFYTDVHRTTDGTFYATLSTDTNQNGQLSNLGGFYRSVDGENWNRIFAGSGILFRRTEIGSSPSNPDIVYFISDTRNTHELRRYNAATFEMSIQPGLPINSNDNDLEAYDSQTSYDMYVRVHPTQENTVLLGGTNLYRSTNAFADRTATTWIGGYDPDFDGVAIYPEHHPDQHDLVFLPANPSVAYSVNDGGIFRTNDIMADEVSYASLNNGFITTQYYTAYVSQAPRDNFVFGGLQDNGSLLTGTTLSTDNTTRILGGDGGFAASTRFGIYYYMSFQNSRIFRLTLNDEFGITSFARVDPIGGGSDPDQPYLFINPYTLDPNNGNRMYLAGGDFLWRNRNLAQIPSGEQEPTSLNWTQLSRTEITEGVISAVEVSTEPENIVYYGTTTGRVFRMDNAQTDSYTVTEIGQRDFPEGGSVNSIVVNPLDASQVMVIFSNYNIPSIFYSVDGGANFTDVSGSLEEQPDGSGNGPSVRWGRIVPKTDGTFEYYVATSTGVYSTTSLEGTATTWQLESPEEIGNSIVNMIDYRRLDGRIVAATHGNGLFTSSILNVVRQDEIQSGNSLEFQAPFPNPFVDEVTIRFNLPETNFVLARVYNSSGQLVRVLSNGLGFEGNNELFWDGRSTQGSRMAPGVYLVRLTYRNENFSTRVVLTN